MEWSTIRSMQAPAGRGPKLGEASRCACGCQPCCQWAGEVWSEAGTRINAMTSAGVTVLRCSPMLGAAVKPFLTGDRFFLGQVDAAMGAADHFRGAFRFRRRGCLGSACRLGALDRPDDQQNHQQQKEVFHPIRPSRTSMTKREPAYDRSNKPAPM